MNIGWHNNNQAAQDLTWNVKNAQELVEDGFVLKNHPKASQISSIRNA